MFIYFNQKFRFDIKKKFVLTCLFFVWTAVGLSQTSLAIECARPAKKISLTFDFEWPNSSLTALAKKLRMQCGEPENYTRLLQVIKLYLTDNGIDLKDIALHDHGTHAIPQLQIVSTGSAGLNKSATIPIQYSPEKTDIIPVFLPRLTANEGEEIVIGYVTDDILIRSLGGVVKMHWLRDGVAVPDAHKTRYQLSLSDVGKRVSAVLSVRVDDRVIAYQKTDLTEPVTMAERAPLIKSLTIVGEAVIGEEIQARYRFFDINPEDKEGDTKFTWLRGSTLITGSHKAEYVIVPADLGQIISVRVKPKSNDGITGDVAVASMNSAVDDGLVKFALDALDNLPITEDQMGETELELEEIFAADANVTNVERRIADDEPSFSLPRVGNLVGEQYIQQGLRLSPSSPIQFIGLKHSPSKLFTEQKFKQVAFEFLGRPINERLLREAIERVNNAYIAAGFHSSRAVLPDQIVEDGVVKIKLIEERPW